MYSGEGEVQVGAGASLSSLSGYIGQSTGGSGRVLLEGADARWQVGETLIGGGRLNVGELAPGELRIGPGALVDAGRVLLGAHGLLRLQEGGTLRTETLTPLAGSVFDWQGGTLRLDGAVASVPASFALEAG